MSGKKAFIRGNCGEGRGGGVKTRNTEGGTW